MAEYKLETPVLFTIFNRPDTTWRVFQEIRQARPPQLFISADGPRPTVAGEAERCRSTRAIVEQVDWDCEIFTNFKDENWGCKKAQTSGISWFFEHVPAGIILEDDDLPHPTFFRYCQELLARYRDDERIMMISGDNFQPGGAMIPYSYYFSRYFHLWGWASWRRAWRHYDVNMAMWPEIARSKFLSGALSPAVAAYWHQIFDLTFQEQIDTWDYQWLLHCWVHNGLCIVPKVNLVSNIGFGNQPTHCHNPNDPGANMPTQAMEFPLHSPPYVFIDAAADRFEEVHVYKISIIKVIIKYALYYKSLKNVADMIRSDGLLKTFWHFLCRRL